MSVFEMLLNRTTFTAKALPGSPNQNPDGSIKDGQHATSNRASGEPVNFKGRAVLMNHKERIEYGVRGSALGWKILAPQDPKLDVDGQVEFLDDKGTTRTLRVIAKSQKSSTDHDIYKTMTEEVTTD